jgi:hypothetical protein
MIDGDGEARLSVKGPGVAVADGVVGVWVDGCKGNTGGGGSTWRSGLCLGFGSSGGSGAADTGHGGGGGGRGCCTGEPEDEEASGVVCVVVSIARLAVDVESSSLCSSTSFISTSSFPSAFGSAGGAGDSDLPSRDSGGSGGGGIEVAASLADTDSAFDDAGELAWILFFLSAASCALRLLSSSARRKSRCAKLPRLRRIRGASATSLGVSSVSSV